MERFPLSGRARLKFWSRVQFSRDGCWKYMNKEKTASRPYAMAICGGIRSNAPRIAWMIANGTAVPAEMYVLHSCDNPSCVRPAHLHLGTQSDNMREMVERGRASTRKVTGLRGEKNPKSRISDNEQAELEKLYAAGWSTDHLSKKFGISKNAINNRIRRRGLTDKTRRRGKRTRPLTMRCLNGHEYTNENIRYERYRNSRICQICYRQKIQRRRAKQ